MQSNSERIVSKSSPSAPTQKTSFASAATGAEPVTGASTKRTPRRAASAAITFENDGFAELQSTQSEFVGRQSKNPLPPSAALFDRAWIGQHREQDVHLFSEFCG